MIGTGLKTFGLKAVEYLMRNATELAEYYCFNPADLVISKLIDTNLLREAFSDSC